MVGRSKFEGGEPISDFDLTLRGKLVTYESPLAGSWLSIADPQLARYVAYLGWKVLVIAATIALASTAVMNRGHDMAWVAWLAFLSIPACLVGVTLALSGLMAMILDYIFEYLHLRRLHLQAGLPLKRRPWEARKENLIGGVPGARMISACQFLLPKKTFHRVIEPTYADFWEEYAEALSQGQRRKARWIHVRFYLTLALVLAQQVISASLYKVFEDVLERVGRS